MSAPQVFTPAAATSLDQAQGSAMSALYRAAIGPVNTDYYLPVFERFEAAGRAGPSWNRAACLCTLNWMVFRQMWPAALLYGVALSGATLLILGLGRLVFLFSNNTALCLLVALGTVAFLAPGVWGNALLHRHLRKAMQAALAVTTTVPEACVLLNRQASTRQRIVWLAMANAAFAGAVLGLYIAWPHTQRPATVTGPPVLKPALASRVAAAASAPAQAASVPAPAVATPTGANASVGGAITAAAAAASSVAAPMPAPVVAAARPTPTPTPTPTLIPTSPPPPGPTSPSPSPSPTPTPTPTPTSTSTSTSTPTPTPTLKASITSASARLFYINVGLFADDDNARKAHARLLEAGLTAFTEQLDTAKGKRTRVRVGPFDTQTAADTAAGKIRDLKLEAVVFRQ